MKLPRISPVPRSTPRAPIVRDPGTVHPASSTNFKKTAILQIGRPSFVGQAAKVSCPNKSNQSQSLDHLIPWASIRNGYYASMNPGSNGSCTNNLGLLYASVGLSPDSNSINTACGSSNVNNNSATQIDKSILSTLNSATTNLRCGFSSANQSVSNALDIPCGDQSFNSQQNRIEIGGTSAQRLSFFLAINSTDPQPPFVFKTNQSCQGGGGCNNSRVQTSDCSNDVGASVMPPQTAPAFYLNKFSGTLTHL
ncbi:MAG: hypothetical protein AAF799_24920 [Myxococcota bacterium]